MRQTQEIKIKYKGKGYVVSAAQIAYAYMYYNQHMPFPGRLQTGRDWIVYHKVGHDWQKYESYLTHLTKYSHLVVGLDVIILEAQMARV